MPRKWYCRDPHGFDWRFETEDDGVLEPVPRVWRSYVHGWAAMTPYVMRFGFATPQAAARWMLETRGAP